MLGCILRPLLIYMETRVGQHGLILSFVQHAINDCPLLERLPENLTWGPKQKQQAVCIIFKMQ